MNYKLLLDRSLHLLESIKPRTIGKRTAEMYKRDQKEAVCEIFQVLSDGKWHRKSTINQICKDYSLSPYTLMEICHIGESDCGYWVCIPNDKTPMEAPDEHWRERVNNHDW